MKILLVAFLFPVLAANAQRSFDKKIEEAAKQLQCDPPTQIEPVSINAQLVTDNDSVAIIVKASIAPGWHIYSYVPSNLPYIQLENKLELPKDLHAVGSWNKTQPRMSFNDPGVLQYETEAIFIQKAIKVQGAKEQGKIKAGLYYQTCNLRQCLQPMGKMIDL